MSEIHAIVLAEHHAHLVRLFGHVHARRIDDEVAAYVHADGFVDVVRDADDEFFVAGLDEFLLPTSTPVFRNVLFF
jgi:hypothetical protein